MANARQDNALGLRKRLRAVSDFNLRAKMAQGLDDRSQIAGFVVDHGNSHHSNPLVEGNISAN